MICNRSCYFRSKVSIRMIELRDMIELHVQGNDHLASLVIHMEKESVISQFTRDINRKNYTSFN